MVPRPMKPERERRPWPTPLADRVTEDASAEQVAEAIAALWQEIDQALHPIIGHRGVAALYHRSLHLTAAAYPWLAIGHRGLTAEVDPSALTTVLAQRGAAEAAAGGAALFQSFRELLTSLVGASLTDRLLRSVWAHPAGISPAQDTSS
jgi:hypothetical protein